MNRLFKFQVLIEILDPLWAFEQSFYTYFQRGNIEVSYAHIDMMKFKKMHFFQATIFVEEQADKPYKLIMI